MTIYTLSHGPLKLDVSDQAVSSKVSGVIRRRSYVLVKKRCGNRCLLFSASAVCKPGERNHFVWQGREYQLQPNVEWDRTICTATAGWGSGNVPRAAI